MATSKNSIETASKTFEEEARLPAWILNDDSVFEYEKERIFHKAWIFLGHESEIPDPGDYITRYIADDCFIVIRDENEEVNVHLNACTHKGMQLCRTQAGNASHFRCPYHGWTFDNEGDLVGVPNEETCYGEEGLERDEWSLSSPRVDSYKGMIFGCLDPDAESLDEYLGDFKWYMDYYIGRDEEMEIVGTPQRWIVDADWKLGADNFIGDDYHTHTTHQSTVELDILSFDNLDFLVDGVMCSAGRGGMCFKDEGLLDIYPEKVQGLIQEALDDDQLQTLMEFQVTPINGSLFPNLSLVNVAGKIGEEEGEVPYTSLRKWRPVAPGKIEIWSWCIVEKGASEEYKERVNKTYQSNFGSSGMLEQDDAENWRRITDMAGGKMAEKEHLNFQMGMAHDYESIPEWPGPGTAHPQTYNDLNHRHFWSTYFEFMEERQ